MRENFATGLVLTALVCCATPAGAAEHEATLGGQKFGFKPLQ